MGPTVRATSLRGFVPLVTQLGADPDRLLARFGFSIDTVASGTGVVPITAHDLMLDAASGELDCPDLGLRLADLQDLTILGPLATAIEASSTVGEAIDCAARFLFVHSPALSVGIEPDPYGRAEVVALTYQKDLLESPYSPQGIELGLALFYRFADSLVADRMRLRSVELPHQPRSAVQRYVEYFGADVKFGRPTAALRVSRTVLDAPFPGRDSAVRQHAVQRLTEQFPRPEHQVVQRVRRILAARLPTSPTLAGVARQLAVHPRTLQRRLAAEDARFDTLLDAVRRDAAHRLITTTDRPLARVTELVGFAEQSTLSHAVRRWFGVGPRELRRSGSRTLSP